MRIYFGRVKGNGNSTSRCGTKSSGVMAYLQSRQGGIKVSVHRDVSGHDIYRVELAKNEFGQGRDALIYQGTISGKCPTDKP